MSTGAVEKKIKHLRALHLEIAGRIEQRLAVFNKIREEGDDCALFIELVFCILTPQSGARRCWRAVELLLGNNCLFDGGFDDICPALNIVRFKNNKTSYILEARKLFIDGGVPIGSILEGCDDIVALREWFVANVKGLGYKEASHFLRNVGRGESIAILDRHILRSMQSLGLIRQVPSSLSPRVYGDLERRLADFAAAIDIPLGHLDFLLWYDETGDIFK